MPAEPHGRLTVRLGVGDQRPQVRHATGGCAEARARPAAVRAVMMAAEKAAFTLEQGVHRGSRSFRHGGNAVGPYARANPRLRFAQSAATGRAHGKFGFKAYWLKNHRRSHVRWVTTAIMLLCGSCICNQANARVEIRGIYVFSEDTDVNDRSCALTKESAVAAVEFVLRRNRIRILSEQEQFSHFAAYVNFGALSTGTACSVSYNIKMYIRAQAIYVPGNKLISGVLEVCYRSGIMTGPKYNLQERLDSAFVDYMQQCISAAEKSDE